MTVKPVVSSTLFALFIACAGDSTAPDDTSSGPPKSQTVWRSVALGARHACGLVTDGTAYCWGFNGSGQLGVGTLGGTALSPVLVETDLKFEALALGVNHSCALTTSGATFCWGQANTGFLNDGITEQIAVPTRVVGVPAFKAIGAGASTCGLAETGAITCWENALIPVPQGLPAFQQLAVGWSTYCGVTAGGEAHCWGSNYNGQLGQLDAVAPVVVGEALRFRSLAVGKDHVCGVALNGALHCWGLNQRGQLGIGTTSLFEPATKVATSLLFDAVTVGAQNSCGLVGRTAHCWAYNLFGQVGDGTLIDRSSPVPVVDGHEFAALDVGDFGPEDAALELPSVICGVTVSGAVYCWGYGMYGQLGIGQRIASSTRPMRLAEPTPRD